MNLVYELLYLLGVRPWERGGVDGELRALVEGPGALPAGRALELGCGTGGPAVYLAAHGWDVTGVDVVARALRQARGRAAQAGVRARFVRADVAQLRGDASVGRGYDLLLDTGCYHGLDDDRRAAFGEAVGEVAAPGAALLLFALEPGARRPRAFRGASEAELRARLSGAWELAWRRPRQGPSVLRGGQFWYLFRRQGADAS